jgi:predicted nucleic acid-binding protein
MILLDTDIMVDILRDYPPAVQWMQSLGDEAIALPGFVVMELIQGCQTKTELTNIRKRLAPFQVYWPEADDCNQAVELFAQYHPSHQMGIDGDYRCVDWTIGCLDKWIPLYFQ